MKAAVTPRYGAASVLQVQELDPPELGEHDLLIQVAASPVTAGDRRLRAADFPSFTVALGRLMVGVLRPRHSVQGTMFAGRVVSVGRSVTRFQPGDDVFGSVEHGAYAESLRVPESSALAKLPRGMSYEEAAAAPYGGITALKFLQDLAGVKQGERVLIVGASGGVGRFAVQLAKHMGAEVTGVCSARNMDLVRSLGADHVIDYAAQDLSDRGRYDVIFDIAGVSSFQRSRRLLSGAGRYLTLFISLRVLLDMAVTSLRRGPTAKFAVAIGDQHDMERLRELLERKVLRPVVARRFPLERIADAHRAAEEGRLPGSVVVTMGHQSRSRAGREAADSSASTFPARGSLSACAGTPS